MLRSPRSPAVPATLVAVAARVRLRLVRRRSLSRLAGVGCVGLGVWAGATTLGALADARDAWGTTVPVAVADVALGPGDHAGPGTVSLREWPAALVPPGALRSVPDATVRQRLEPGEPLSAADVGPAGGPAGLLPKGWVAVAIPLDESRRPPLAVADTVGVVVDSTRTTGGAVVEVSVGLVVVAVPATDAARVVAAALDGAVGLTLEPPAGSAG